MLESVFENGAYVINDGPEYQDTTYIKIDYYSDDEAEEDLSSMDTLHLPKTEIQGSQLEIHEAPQNLFYHPLKSKVEQRMKNLFQRLRAKENLAGFGADKSIKTSTDELIEFINVVTNGHVKKEVKPESTKLQPTMPKMRGRPRKHLASIASIKNKRSKKHGDESLYVPYKI